MVKVKLVQNVMEANESLAEDNKKLLRDKGIFTIDLMSSPGSGKTTVLERTLEVLGDELSISVIEGDVYTTRDAERVEAKGAQVVQINTGGACHLDANMVRDAIGELDLGETDLLVIENVGNLICPVKFRLGEADRVMVLSIAEGPDKPEKYPAMFRSCSVALVNKIDLLEASDLALEDFTREIRKVNPEMTIIPVCALTGEGMEEWYRWLRDGIKGARGDAGRE